MADAMQWLESCSPLLGDVAWKGALLLAAAWIVDRLWLRRRLLGADMLWAATLLGLLALPLGAAMLPRVTLPVWPAPAAVKISPEETAPISMMPAVAADASLADKAHEASLVETIPQAPAVPAQRAMVVQLAWPSLAATVASIWLLGGTVLLVRLVWGIASMAKLIQRATPISDVAYGGRWQSALAVRKRQLGVNRSVQLLASEETAIPFTTGWFWPAIVVPTDVAASANEATIDATLLHELTHIARGDYSVHLAGKLVEACYWWNPLAWLATARLSATRESICDGYCCWQMGDCERYGNALLALAERLTRRPFGGVGLAMARGSRLGKRLQAITALTITKPAMAGRQRLGITLCVMSVSLLSAGVTLGTEKPSVATLAEVVARVKEFEDSIETLAGSFRCHAEHSYQVAEVAFRRGPQQEREEITTNRLAVTTVDRLASFEWQQGERERLESESSSVTKVDGVETQRFRGKHVSVFDGAKGWSCTTPLAEDGKPLPTEGQKLDSAGDFIRPELQPISCVLSQGPKRLSQILAHKNAKVVRTETVAKRPTLVVEADPVITEHGYRYGIRLWIDLERSVAVRREAWSRTNEAEAPTPLLVIECSEYQEAAPGIWLPMKFKKHIHHIDPDESDQQGSTDLVEMHEWKVNVKIPPERFEEPFPAGVKILQTPMPAPSPAANPDEPIRLAEPSPNNHQLKVIVVDEAGQPISGAQVHQHHVHIPPGVRRSKITKVGNYRTDAAGQLTLACEEQPIYLWVVASHPGRVPLHAVWQRESRATSGEIPEELRFTLKPATMIGGVVRDEAGKPIAGAKVEIFNVFTGMPRPAGEKLGVRSEPLPWLAQGETAIVTDEEGRWQATNIPSDEELGVTSKGPEMALPAGARALPLRLRISRNGFDSHDGTKLFESTPGYRNSAAQDEIGEEVPSLAALRSGEAIVILKAQEDASNAAVGETGAASKAPPPADETVDSKEYPDPPKLAYLAWELPPSKNGPQLSRAWNARGEEIDESLSTETIELNGKTYRPRAWNWDDDTLKLHAHPLVLGFEDGAPFEYRPTLVAVVDASGEKHYRGQALSRRWEKRLVSVAAPEKPFAWPERVNLEISYPIEATQTIAELTKFADQPIKVADGVDWKGRVEADGRFASTLIIWRKPQDEDRTSYHAALFDGEGAPLRNDAGGVVRTFDDRQERVEWYEGLRPEEIARVKVHRQRRATAKIEDVPIRLDLLPKE